MEKGQKLHHPKENKNCDTFYQQIANNLGQKGRILLLTFKDKKMLCYNLAELQQKFGDLLCSSCPHPSVLPRQILKQKKDTNSYFYLLDIPGPPELPARMGSYF